MKALLIGGGGRMGRWFADFLASESHEVVTVDPAGPVEGFASAPTLAAGLRGLTAKDAVLVCTPMQQASACLAEVRVRGTEALVADIASIKAPVRDELRALAQKGFQVCSLHPMWGPEALTLADKNLIVMDCGNLGAAERARGLFAHTAVHVRAVPLDDHDRLMGWALGLPHALNLAFSLALMRADVAAGDLEALGGPTMQQQLATARLVAQENKALYHGIQALNPHMPEVWSLVEQACKELQGAAGDAKAFAALMAACEAYYARAGPREAAP